MPIYRGFGFHAPVRGGPMTVHAQHLPEAGAWNGFGHVGMMPDLACAKAYVDWLHDTGPEQAPAISIEDYVDGHFVVVNGREPDENALLAGRLRNIAAALRDPAIDGAGLKQAFGDLVSTINSIDIAADQKGSARAVGNFFLTPSDKNGVRHEAMHLGNFGMPGEWNGDGLVAVGVGDGWVPTIADKVMAKPVSAFANHHLGTVDAPSGYARSVFVAGREPKIDASSRDDLKHYQDVLRSYLNYGVTDQKREYLVAIAGILDEVSDRLDAPSSELVAEESTSPTL